MQAAASERTTTWAPGRPPADPHFFGIEWNAEDQLTRALTNGTEVARYKYDPNGRRVERVAGGATTLWAYDGEDILRETVGGTAGKYIHGPGIDYPLAQEDAAGVLSHLHADGLGSILRTSSAAGGVTSSRQYDAFGNLEVGPTSGYAFTGREWDAAAGLAYYRARYYDPKVGRFITEDPIGFRGGSNFYSYVGNRPVLSTDPTGQLSCVQWPDGRVTCVPDPSLCLGQGWCSPWPPKCPGGFVYYGLWGGPGWTGGQCGSWNTINQAKALPPRDRQDAAYCEHDTCYGNCASMPTAWQRFLCRAGCDRQLTNTLVHVVMSSGPNAYALAGIAAFNNNMGAITSMMSDETTSGGRCCGR